MVGAAHDAVFPGLGEVLPEARVDDVAALGGLDEGEGEGQLIEGGLVAKQLPVDGTLMVAYVDAAHRVALGRYDGVGNR